MSVVLVDPQSNHSERDVLAVRSIAELADRLLTPSRGMT